MFFKLTCKVLTKKKETAREHKNHQFWSQRANIKMLFFTKTNPLVIRSIKAKKN